MAVTGTYTNRQILTDAFRKIGVVAEDDDMNADQASAGTRVLSRMLKALQNKGANLWTYTSQTVTLTTAASYTMSPVRPLRILNVNFNDGSTETPMQELTRDEYKTLPVKTTTGTPTTYYYDRQRESALLYIWPVLSSASGETLEVDYEREIEDVDLDDAADVPGEWYDAVVYGLASRLSDDYGVDDVVSQRVMARAEKELDIALTADREGSVFWNSDGYR
jgi:hypothetical protein